MMMFVTGRFPFGCRTHGVIVFLREEVDESQQTLVLRCMTDAPSFDKDVIEINTKAHGRILPKRVAAGCAALDVTHWLVSIVLHTSTSMGVVRSFIVDLHKRTISDARVTVRNKKSVQLDMMYALQSFQGRRRGCLIVCTADNTNAQLRMVHLGDEDDVVCATPWGVSVPWATGYTMAMTSRRLFVEQDKQIHMFDISRDSARTMESRWKSTTVAPTPQPIEGFSARLQRRQPDWWSCVHADVRDDRVVTAFRDKRLDMYDCGTDRETTIAISQHSVADILHFNSERNQLVCVTVDKLPGHGKGDAFVETFDLRRSQGTVKCVFLAAEYRSAEIGYDARTRECYSLATGEPLH